MKKISVLFVCLTIIMLLFSLSGCFNDFEDLLIDEKWKVEQFDIIIQAGQSNSDGCGIGDASEEYVKKSEVLYLTSDFKISEAEEKIENGQKINNLSLSFADEYIKEGKLQEGRKLLIIRAAVGGTGFADNRWTPDGDLKIKMHKLIKAALELNSQNRLVAFLWHQGETDAMHGVLEQQHYNNLTQLVNSVRVNYECENIPFVAGGFVNEWQAKNAAACAPIIEAIKRVCNNLPAAEFVETYDLKSNNQEVGNGDDIHFCREALNILGKRYYEAFKLLLAS